MYQLAEPSGVIRLSDNAWIPFASDNIDYQEYLAWVDEGNTADPAPEPPAPVELTAEEKLAAAGLTLEEFGDLVDLVLNP